MFDRGLGDLGSITGWVIPETQKWYLMPPCLTLSIIRYRSRVKWSNPGNGVVPIPAPRCNSYWKGSLWSPPLLTLQLNQSLKFNKAIEMARIYEQIRKKCWKDRTKKNKQNLNEIGKFQKYSQWNQRKKYHEKNVADAASFMTGASVQQKDNLVKNATASITPRRVAD